jgi:DtxR family transcriptional regulator, Mn-dependent transcriptional regulator
MSDSGDSAPLSSAMEDYLEAIFHLEKERRVARVRDIANRLGVKMSSVTSALRTLSSRGLVLYDPHQYLTLTERGLVKAREVVRRHRVLKSFLSTVLQTDDGTAEENACRMEHHLDPEVVERLVAFVDFIQMCPIDHTRWAERREERRGESCNDCALCLDRAGRKLQSRAAAQKAAVRDGMTLAETETGAQVLIAAVRGTSKFKTELAAQGVEAGAVVLVEDKDPHAGRVDLDVKGYRISVDDISAAKIRVKPI